MNTTNRTTAIARTLRNRAREQQAEADRCVDHSSRRASKCMAAARAYFDAARIVEQSAQA